MTLLTWRIVSGSQWTPSSSFLQSRSRYNHTIKPNQLAWNRPNSHSRQHSSHSPIQSHGRHTWKRNHIYVNVCRIDWNYVSMSAQIHWEIFGIESCWCTLCQCKKNDNYKVCDVLTNCHSCHGQSEKKLNVKRNHCQRPGVLCIAFF